MHRVFSQGVWVNILNPKTALFFFAIVVSLFPLGIGPELEMLRGIAPGIFWVAALLASMLALERLFQLDYQDGTLEQMLLTPQPVFLLVLVVTRVVSDRFGDVGVLVSLGSRRPPSQVMIPAASCPRCWSTSRASYSDWLTGPAPTIPTTPHISRAPSCQPRG